MILRQLFHPESSTYTYILADSTWRDAVVIDAVANFVDPVLEVLEKEQLQLTHILDTHVHADHITAASQLRQRTGARVVMSRAAGADCADIQVDDGDFVVLGDDVIRVISTPGHTRESLSFRWYDRVFTGDALLIGGCGRTDFQGGDAGTLYDSITQKLFSLPDETLVYPGHDYKGRRVSCIGEEKQLNPRLAGKSREAFIAIMDDLDLPAPKKIDESVPANRLCGMSNEEH